MVGCYSACWRLSLLFPTSHWLPISVLQCPYSSWPHVDFLLVFDSVLALPGPALDGAARVLDVCAWTLGCGVGWRFTGGLGGTGTRMIIGWELAAPRVSGLEVTRSIRLAVTRCPLLLLLLLPLLISNISRTHGTQTKVEMIKSTMQ